VKIAIVVNANQDTGYGHYHRCRALAFELVKIGHETYFVGDVQPRVPGVRYLSAWRDEDVLYHLEGLLPHWVIVDTPDDTPEWVYSGRWAVCAIDGVGQPNSQKADLIISQGLLEGEYAAPKYLMLRPELDFVETSHRQREWVVFGGGFDEIGLCQTFSYALPDQTALLVASRLKSLEKAAKHYVNFSTADAHIMSICGTGKKACLAMGMTVWEMLYLKVPCWVFSKTERHLESAKKMSDWLHYWPEVGLPEKQRFADFLSLPPIVTKCPLDRQGARRVAELIR